VIWRLIVCQTLNSVAYSAVDISNASRLPKLIVLSLCKLLNARSVDVLCPMYGILVGSSLGPTSGDQWFVGT
jgi:hypothetical protein